MTTDTDSAASLLVAAGDNSDRIGAERSWARLCGVTPLPANSSKVNARYRLNRGGDRQANAALAGRTRSRRRALALGRGGLPSTVIVISRPISACLATDERMSSVDTATTRATPSPLISDDDGQGVGFGSLSATRVGEG